MGINTGLNPSHMDLKLVVNTDRGSLSERYCLGFSTAVTNPIIHIATLILKMRGYMLDAQSRIVNAILSLETKKGSNPADAMLLPQSLYQVPVLLNDPIDIAVPETEVGDTADPEQGLQVYFSVVGGGVQKRLFR